MAELNPAGWFQNRSDHSAQLMRLNHTAMLEQGALSLEYSARGGVVINGNSMLDVTQSSPAAMSVVVGKGMCFVRGTENQSQGVYACISDAPVTLTITAADPSLARTDLVVARVRDAFYSGVTNAWALEVVTGTPGGGVPALPASSLELGRVSVGAGVTTIVTANIDMTNVIYASAIGGIQQWPTKAKFDAVSQNSRQVFLDRATETLWYHGTFGTQNRILTEKLTAVTPAKGVKYDGTATLFNQSGSTEAVVSQLSVTHDSPSNSRQVMGRVHCYVQSTVANDRVTFRVRDTDASGTIRGTMGNVLIPAAGITVTVDFNWWFPSAFFTGLVSVVTCQRVAGTGTVTITGLGATSPSWHILDHVPMDNITVTS